MKKLLISFLTALALSMAVSVIPAYCNDIHTYANDSDNSGTWWGKDNNDNSGTWWGKDNNDNDKWWENIPPLGFPGPDVIRVHVDLSLSRAPLLGQSTEAEVTIKLNSKMVESLGSFTEAVIVLPEGFALVNGATSWRGYIPKDGSIKFNAILQSVKTGDWKIDAFARCGSNVYWEYGKDQIYVSVSETTAIVRKTEEPHVDNYDNTEHPIKAQHGKSLILQNMTTEYIVDTSYEVGPLTTYTITVSATLVIKLDGDYYPRRMVKVEIWDSDPFPDPDDHLGTTYTNNNGYFEITVSHGDPNGIDIYWKCFLDSPSDRGVRVMTSDPLADDYVYVSPVFPNQTSDNYFGSWYITGGAPNIYHQITNAWYYLDGEVGYQTPKVTTHWPSGPYPGYDAGANKIHLPAGWEYENFAIVHEYGHHVMNAVYGYVPYGSRAETWFEEEGSSYETAWAEGWANFFPLLIMNTNTLIVAQGHGVWWFPITVNYETRWNSQGIPWDNGDIVEANITAALWDLYDSADDGYDSYDGGLSNIWDTISSQTDDTYEEFYEAWVARGHGRKEFLLTAYQNTINYGCFQVRLEPTDDAFTDLRDNPGGNYGSESWIGVNRATKSGVWPSGLGEGTFLKFDLSDIPANATIIKATFGAHAYQIWYSTTCDAALREFGTNWDEYTITGNNAPWATLGSTVSSTVRGSVPGWWTHDVNVSYVQQKLGGQIGFYYCYPGTAGATHYGQVYRSREYADATYRPYLEIVYTIGGQTVNIYPSDDAFVDSQDNPGGNYGSETWIAVNLAGASKPESTWLKFDLSSIPSSATVMSAVFKAYAYQIWWGDKRSAALWDVTTNDWGESTITANNAPWGNRGSKISSDILGSVPGWWEWDVTSWVDTHKGTIRSAWLSNAWSVGYTHYGQYYYSKEYANAAYRPYLEVTYS